jgi:hypothetical protein
MKKIHRKFFTLWLINYGTGWVMYNDAVDYGSPIYDMYYEIPETLRGLMNIGLLECIEYIDAEHKAYRLTDKCIQELNRD